MCFYRDTQAALERNTLQNLIKQRKNWPPKESQNSEQLESQASAEPYKQLHIRRFIFLDER